MELQSCSTLHFINAIKDGLVIKIRNVDLHGRPGLVLKKLKDIYGAECARNVDAPSTLELQDGYENGVVDHNIESPCLPMAERKTSERDWEVNILNYNGDGDEIYSGSDYLLFKKMTLKQLKKRCKTKKRKISDLVCLTPKQEFTDFQPEEDEYELSKNAKSKKNCNERSVSTTSKLALSIKTEQIFVAEDSQQSRGDICAPITIKVEFPVLEYSECQIMNSLADGSSICNEQASLFGVDSTKVLQTTDSVLENRETLSLAGQVERCVLNEISYEHLEVVDPVLQTTDTVLENRETLSLTGQVERCVLNEISYEHLEDVDPTPLLPQFSGEIMELNTQKQTGQHSSVSHVSEFLKETYIEQSPSSQSFPHIVFSVDDQSSDMCNSSQSCSNMQEISSSHSGYQVSYAAINDGLCCIKFGYGSEFCMIKDDIKKSSDVCNSSESCSNLQEILGRNSGCQVSDVAIGDSLCCTDNDLVSLENSLPTIDNKQPLISNIVDTARNCLKPNNHLTVLVDASSTTEEKHSPKYVTADVERRFSSGLVNELSTLETKNYHDVERWQLPERLPSARKAISPTSQERLCLAMNSVDLYDNTDHHNCKGKLFFEKQVDNKALPAGSDVEGVESSIKVEGPGQVTRTKAIIWPKKILKKPKHKKTSSPPNKGSPPKGCPEGPHLSRSLPHLSTGCTSIENCSESAIAFSQRQMHDIESLAMKLMTELKSMKDIVEEKLLYEAYRSTSLRNDADEVKTAIKSARKVEETSKKWLSMMARDCNRFCKIMRLTEDGSATTENVIHKEKKKISFADEAGGMLCHVNFFEKGMALGETNSESQKLQAKEC